MRKRSTEQNSWHAMKGRCLNPNNLSYKDFGGRGIRVCDEWRDSFDTFLKDVGPKPSPRHSLGRIDKDGDYTPSNARWETPLEQEDGRRNKKQSKKGSWKALYLEVSTPEYIRLKVHAAFHNSSMQMVVRNALSEYLSSNKIKDQYMKTTDKDPYGADN